MKTAFPEPEPGRYIIVDADTYAQHFALIAPESRHSEPSHPPVLTAEEKAVEKLGVTIGVAAIEVFMGRRQVHHLSPWMTPRCYKKLSQHVHTIHNMLKATLPAAKTSVNAKHRLAVYPKRVIVQKVADTAYEISLLVHDTRKVRAVAIRVESFRRQWKVSALEIA